MRLLLFVTIFFLFISGSVLAQTYIKDTTTYTLEDINGSVSVLNDRIIIDDDTYQFSYSGGVLDVIINDKNEIALNTSVSQTVDFSIIIDGNKQFLTKNGTNYANSLYLEADKSTIYGLKSTVDTQATIKQKNDNKGVFFEIEVYQQTRPDGKIVGTNLTIMNYYLYILLGLIFLGVIIWIIRR